MAKVKRAALPLAKSAIRVGLGVATYGATEVGGAAFDAAITKISAITDEAIDKQWKAEANRISAMQGFRDALRALTGEGAEARKIVFIVDELDRCRPDYALSLLEIIKHFFAVPNVHFVLGVNLKELENSVKARYGAEIGATKYLQKFVSLTMQLPNSRGGQSVGGASLDYYDTICSQYITTANLSRDIKYRLPDLIKGQEVSLRDIQRLVTCFALIPKHFESQDWAWRIIVVGAAFMKVLHPHAFSKLRAGQITLEDIEHALSMPRPKLSENTRAVDRDWAVWACALIGKEGMQDLKVSEDAIIQVSSSFGVQFRWRDCHHILAEMFDTFSLPDSTS